MMLGTKDPLNASWAPATAQEAALHALGASSVAFHPDGTVEVEPDIDLSGYAAALSTAAKGVRTAAARGHFAGLMAAGFTSGGVLYALDPQSIANATAAGAQAGMVGLNATGYAWPAGFTYPSASGSRQAMTAAQMAALANNLFRYVAGCDQQLSAILTEIAAAADVAAVNAIDVTAGYPTASA